MMNITCFVIGMIGTNVYLIQDEATGKLAVIDPADHSDELLEPVIEEPSYNLSKPHGITVAPFQVDRALEDGDTIMLGETELRFMLTPGHTMGSGCYLTDECIFSGDTLFCASVGRTDFPTSSMQDMMQSVERLKNLEGDYRVYPGHDMFTSLERERKHNPFMR